jgi:HSP20 family protein
VEARGVVAFLKGGIMSLLPRRRGPEERGPLAGLQHEMNRLFEDFFSGGGPLRSLFTDGDTFLPAVDIRETNDKIVIDAELPGLNPQDVTIRVEGERLVLSGERRQEKKEQNESYARVERSYGRFERQLQLPPGVDPEKVDATFKNGVLTIEIAKKEEAKPKTIEVKVKS